MIKIALANVTPRSLYFAINARVAARDIASRRRWAPEIEFLPQFVRQEIRSSMSGEITDFILII